MVTRTDTALVAAEVLEPDRDPEPARPPTARRQAECRDLELPSANRAFGAFMVEETEISFGPSSRNRLAETSDPSARGAEAALESFYYALNNRDLEALREDWSAHPLAQLDNPVGGIIRGSDAIASLYDRIFSGSVKVQVTFGDVVAYLGDSHAVYAGRESGHYATPDAASIPLEIRTTRYFRYEEGHWRQYHHHGSIDDPDALRAYQRAIRG